MRFPFPTLHKLLPTPHIQPLLVTCALVLAAYSASAWAQGTAASPSRSSVVTPLMAAAAAGDSAKVKSLLADGVSVNTTDAQGRTALMIAVQNRQVETAKALVAAGADVNRESKTDGTPLNIAENDGDAELAAWLITAGAHPTGKSVGDMVCVLPWGGQGFCGRVKSFTVKSVQIAVTRLEGCADGCPARQECSQANPVGGVNGLHVGEHIAVPSWCLTKTGVKQ